MFYKRIFKNYDYVLFLIVLILISLGIIILMSATHVFTTGDTSYITKQGIWIVIGILGMIIAASIDYERLGNYSFRFYIIMVLMLIAVLFTPEVRGARSWFNLGIFSIQPSEFAKIFLILSLAKYIEKITQKDENGINRPQNILILLVYVGIPIFLVLKQPDFGTAVVLSSIVFVMVFVANMSLRYIGPVVIVGILSISVLKFLILNGYTLFFSPHQVKRIQVFFNPYIDPYGSGFNVLQSMLAIGSGQLWGMGLFKGIRTQLDYIPEKTTDFIFSVIGEELGFIVCTIVVMLFMLLLLRCIYIAKMTKDLYGSLIVTGVLTMIGIHVVINIGMTMGILPVTGIPLPFISYGGSSLLTNMIGIGLVMSVARKITV